MSTNPKTSARAAAMLAAALAAATAQAEMQWLQFAPEKAAPLLGTWVTQVDAQTEETFVLKHAGPRAATEGARCRNHRDGSTWMRSFGALADQIAWTTAHVDETHLTVHVTDTGRKSRYAIPAPSATRMLGWWYSENAPPSRTVGYQRTTRQSCAERIRTRSEPESWNVETDENKPLVGVWHGKWPKGPVIELAVEDIETSERARGVYCRSPAGNNAWFWRLHDPQIGARAKGNTLQWTRNASHWTSKLDAKFHITRVEHDGEEKLVHMVTVTGQERQTIILRRGPAPQWGCLSRIDRTWAQRSERSQENPEQR